MILDIFIKGDMADLCIPTQEFAKHSKWYSWFNDPHLNRYIDQGLFPNTPSEQVEFYESQRKNRLLLIIYNKTKQEYMGVISLSRISFIRKCAALALVVESSIDIRNSPLITMESIARISEHGFNILGLNRITFGQHTDLEGFQQRMELLGYKLEGIHEGSFIKGCHISDAVSYAVNYSDYKKIADIRGDYWDGSRKMNERIKKLPQEKFTKMLSDFFNTERRKYYDTIFTL